MILGAAVTMAGRIIPWMSLRIGFDMDGVLVDFEGAYRGVEARLFGPLEHARADSPEDVAEAAENQSPAAKTVANRRRRDAVWAAIKGTPNFWETLAPLDPRAVKRIHDLMIAQRWDVFFITQRPATDGDTVQLQTQRGLVAQGFDLPSVLVIHGSRGAAAAALKLDYLIDDSPQNCVDVRSDSTAKPILIAPEDDAVAASGARRLGFDVYASVGAALDAIEQTHNRGRDGVLQQLAHLAGWK